MRLLIGPLNWRSVLDRISSEVRGRKVARVKEVGKVHTPNIEEGLQAR